MTSSVNEQKLDDLYYELTREEQQECERLCKKEWLVSRNTYERFDKSVKQCFRNKTYFHRREVQDCWNSNKGMEHATSTWWDVANKVCHCFYGREQTTLFASMYRLTVT